MSPFPRGGYQVMKKWLSHHEKALLGRGLTLDEGKEVTNMARRIPALLLLAPALNANYQAVKGATYAWPVSVASAEPTQEPAEAESEVGEPARCDRKGPAMATLTPRLAHFERQ